MGKRAGKRKKKKLKKKQTTTQFIIDKQIIHQCERDECSASLSRRRTECNSRWNGSAEPMLMGPFSQSPRDNKGDNGKSGTTVAMMVHVLKVQRQRENEQKGITGNNARGSPAQRANGVPAF